MLPQLSAPDPLQRRQLVRQLSDLPASATRRWLRWLLQDVDAEVRLQALTAFATTGDPQLLNIATDIATNDRDPRVAELASKILQQLK